MAMIIEFFKTLYHDYFFVIIITVISLAVLIVGSIIFVQIKKDNKEKKMFKENAEKAVSSLTPEEIDNISQNVADKETFYELLSSNKQNNKIDTKTSESTSKNKKVKQQSTQIEEACIGINGESPSEEANPTPKKSTSPTKRAYTGKWKIKETEGKFYAELTASNGGILLQTEKYTSLSGLKNGISTIKKNVDSGNMVTSLDKHGHYRFKLYSSSNRLLCISEDYSSKAKCESGIASVKRFAKTAEMIIEEDD
ncbi:MAG: DUF1508 domain-containing protein [Clostridia bacterium]|nr:DUF1508 domain-containing protein [Clostridia bacterium]